MTDEELIESLRAANSYKGPDFNTPIADPLKVAAADRIEALVKARREDALELLAAHGQAQEAYEAQLKAEARAERLEAALKSLVEHCEMTRDTAGFWKPRQVHQLSPTQWQSWCKQIKSARAALTEAQKEPTDG